MDKNNYLEFVHRIINFLYGSQVIAQDQDLILDEELNGYENLPKNIIGIGKFSTKLIRRDSREYTYYVFSVKRARRNRVYISLNKNFADAKGPIGQKEFFRTYFDQMVSIKQGHAGSRETTIKSKIQNVYTKMKAAGGIISIFGNILRFYFKCKRIRDLSHLIKFIVEEIHRQTSSQMENVGGITWRIKEISKDGKKIKLQAYDRGGIFDFHINNEGKYYPPQVPGDYYADAYSAYCFARKYQETRNEEYLKACKMALQFIKRTYGKYLPSNIVWHHSDFKNPLYIETVEEVLHHYLAEPELAEFRCLIPKMRQDNYEPTNVFALRYHWYRVKEYYGHGVHRRRIKKCVERIQSDQTEEGLIHDNIHVYPDSHDLTYHQYSLACIARGLSYAKDDNDMKIVFLKGAKFSLNILTPDGEVAYVGRGANNIYHAASAIYSFEVASKFLRNEEPEKSSQFKRGAYLIFGYLKQWQLQDGELPTAMNPYVDERVGWHHCETPYNALVSYLLYKAYDEADDTISESSIPCERVGYVNVMNDSGYAVVRSKNYYLAIFGGCIKSFAWSGGTHRTGVSGIAILGIPGRGSLLPILDHPAKKWNRPATDNPYFIVKHIEKYPYGRGRLSLAPSDSPTIKYSRKYGPFSVSKYYVCLPESIIVLTSLKATKKARVDVKGLISASIRADNGWKLHLDVRNRKILSTKDGIGVSFLTIFVPEQCTGTPAVKEIMTNPRGKQQMVYLANIDDLQVKRGDEIIGCCAINLLTEKNVIQDYKNMRELYEKIYELLADSPTANEEVVKNIQRACLHVTNNSRVTTYCAIKM